MSTNNRERRRLKQSRLRKQRQVAGSQGADPHARGSRRAARADEAADELILAAAHAECEGFDGGALRRSSIDALAQGLGLERGCELVAQRLGILLQTGIARALDAGWAPDEITRVIRRRVSATAASFVADPLSEVVRHRHQAGGPDSAPWQAKSRRKLDPACPSWRSDLSSAIAALAFIVHLPALPELDGTTSRTTTAHSPHDERLFSRIRGLLSKAESSDFIEEADAFMAKAQELMTRYCIDRTMLDANVEGGDASQVSSRRVWLEEPYLAAKAVLLAKVASANRCRAVVDRDFGFSTLVGESENLDAAELLFTSLLVQATRHLTTLGRDPTAGTRSRKSSYRRSFLVAYAGRIGVRLREANETATMAADDALGNRLLPVLARRQEELDAAVRELFGELKELKVSRTDIAGWVAGTAAADLAELNVHKKLPVSSTS